MTWLLKWLLIPTVVVAAATVLAAAGWFANALVVTAFGATAFGTLCAWRRKALRLAPEIWDARSREKLSPSVKRRLRRLFWATWGISIAVIVFALLLLILVPEATAKDWPTALAWIVCLTFAACVLALLGIVVMTSITTVLAR